MRPSPPSVIWITGLSGAGKSTLARELAAQLLQSGIAVVVFDGDELRDLMGSTTPHQHGRDARLDLAYRYARLCQMVSRQGITVIIATISLFNEIHKWNRENIPGYYEVYLKVPLSELRTRDPKGIYQRFDAGILTDVAGLDLAVDDPVNPDLVFDHATPLPAESMAAALIEKWQTDRMK